MERLTFLACLVVVFVYTTGCSKQLGSKMPNDLPPNDTVGFLFAQIKGGDVNLILSAFEQLPVAIENNSDRESLGYIIPKLQSLLKHKDDSVRYWAAMSLGKLGPIASETVPDLISSLVEKIDDYSSKSSASGIQYALDQISPNWAARDDIPEVVRKRFANH